MEQSRQRSIRSLCRVQEGGFDIYHYVFKRDFESWFEAVDERMQSGELKRSRDTMNAVELAAVALLDPIANRASPFGATCNVKRYTKNSYSTVVIALIQISLFCSRPHNRTSNGVATIALVLD